MKAFKIENGIVIPLDRHNVDTDAIIPKQFLKSIQRSGFGPNLFDEWRYLDEGKPGQDCSDRPTNPKFALNEPRYQGGTILLARDNFGCGSSREHAVWALNDFGIRVVIAPSFADIFFNNTGKNGILAIKLAKNVIDKLFKDVYSTKYYRLTVDLSTQVILSLKGDNVKFEIDALRKYSLLNGFDDIHLTLQHTDDIRLYEKQREEEAPWLFS